MGRPLAVCDRAEEASVAGFGWCWREEQRGQRRGRLNERALTASCHARTALRSSEVVCVRCAGGAARIEERRVVGRGLRGPSKSSEASAQEHRTGVSTGAHSTVSTVRQCRREEGVDVDVDEDVGKGVRLSTTRLQSTAHSPQPTVHSALRFCGAGSHWVGWQAGYL